MLQLKNLLAAILLFGTMLIQPAIAENRFIFNGEQSFGGEALKVSDSSKIQLGSGVGMALGFDTTQTNSPWSYQMTLGYRINAVSFSNGSAILTVIPLNSILYYQTKLFMIGLGFTYHVRPNYHYNCTDQTACGVSTTHKFDNATGLLMEYNVYITKTSYFGVRYAPLSYTGVEIKNIATGTSKKEIDANSFGIQFGYEF